MLKCCVAGPVLAGYRLFKSFRLRLSVQNLFLQKLNLWHMYNVHIKYKFRRRVILRLRVFSFSKNHRDLTREG